VDPQSTLLHNLTNVLETPSLKDVSECTFHDVSRGEAAVERHDAAPIRVNAMALSWSPMQARRVTDGGVLTVVRDSLTSTSSHVSSSSSPSLDDESENNTSISPFSQPTASSESRGLPASDQRSAMISAQCTPPAGTNDMLAVPIPLPNGHFSCPYCPRKFSQLSKARYGSRALHIKSCKI
jgi:hypothetical protein